MRVILGGAMVSALFAAGWKIYSRLPPDDARASIGALNEQANTEITIVLRLTSPGEPPALELALYPLDIEALQREFSASPHSGKQFDDLLAQRMRGKSPVRAQLDHDGRAIVRVAQGKWWLHARLALADGESDVWRLPVTASGSRQTVELTTENAYERTKKF